MLIWGLLIVGANVGGVASALLARGRRDARAMLTRLGRIYLALLALPVFVLESSVSGGSLFLSVQLFSAFTTLAMAQVYALLKPAAKTTADGHEDF